MGKLGGSKHLRTFAAPEFWPLPVKEKFWTVKPSPGPHSLGECVPLAILVRDVLGYATTMREARKLISKGLIEVDGRVRRNYKHPVGLFDVIRLLPVDTYYRVVPDNTRFFKLVKISREEARIKPLRIENKVTVKGGHMQLNLSDGSNILIRVNDPRNPVEDVYETMGTIVVELPTRKVIDYIPMKEGHYAVVAGGSNVGRYGRIVSVTQSTKRHKSVVTLEEDDGTRFQTSLDYVHVIGRETPIITLR